MARAATGRVSHRHHRPCGAARGRASAAHRGAHHAGRATRRAALRRHRAGKRPPRSRGGQPGQEPVRGQHEPRNPHADERGAGYAAAAAGHGAGRAPARLCGKGRVRRQVAVGHPQRHSGLFQDRGRQTRARPRAVRHRPAVARRGHHHGRQPQGQTAGAAVRPGPRHPARAGGRRDAPAAGAHQSGRQRHQIHRRGQRHRTGTAAAAAHRSRRIAARAAAHRRHRHRHRHRARGTGAVVFRLHAGRKFHHAALWRHRAGAGHQPPAGADDGGRHHRRQHARAGQHVCLRGRVRGGARGARGAGCGRRAARAAVAALPGGG